ncbi:hypothetical protein NIA73_01395 [Anaerobutyricum hallii]|nr:hypothetical protein [Anaerobutyricum hallii]
MERKDNPFKWRRTSEMSALITRPGKKEEEQYIYLDESGKHDWKNDVMPQTIRQYSNFMIFDKTQYVSVLFGWKYSRTLKPDELMRSFSYVGFSIFYYAGFFRQYRQMLSMKN